MKAYWVTNITSAKVNISDLGVYIHPRSSVNLLKGYHLTIEQIEASAAQGSLYSKRDKVIRSEGPLIRKPEPIQTSVLPRQPVKQYVHKPIEERNLLDEADNESDEKFAAKYSEF